MATTKKATAAKRAAASKPAVKSATAVAQAIDRRQAEAGYVLSLVKSLMEDSQRRGQLEVGKQSRATQGQLATTINNIDRTNQLLLRWVRDYVEGK